MTIFEYLTQIFVEKRSSVCLDEYVPYMINRWISFINPSVCETMNNFNNKMLLENKEMHYKILISAFPKLKAAPRISYEKKQTQKTSDNSRENLVKLEAQFSELSEREIKELHQIKQDLNLV